MQAAGQLVAPLSIEAGHDEPLKSA